MTGPIDYWLDEIRGTVPVPCDWIHIKKGDHFQVIVNGTVYGPFVAPHPCKIHVTWFLEHTDLCPLLTKEVPDGN